MINLGGTPTVCTECKHKFKFTKKHIIDENKLACKDCPVKANGFEITCPNCRNDIWIWKVKIKRKTLYEAGYWNGCTSISNGLKQDCRCCSNKKKK